MKEFSEIVELNNNSTLKFKLGEDNSNVIKENYQTFEKINNYMSLDFYIPSIKERKQTIKFYGFPTDEDAKVLASYYTELVNDSILGISIGFDIEKAENVLLSFGYSKQGNLFLKGVVRIKLYTSAKNNEEENKITSIEVSLESKILGNRLY